MAVEEAMRMGENPNAQLSVEEAMRRLWEMAVEAQLTCRRGMAL